MGVSVFFARLLVLFAAVTSIHANEFDNTNLSSNDVAHIGQPYVYENNEVLVVSITTDAEVLRKLVPEPDLNTHKNTSTTIWTNVVSAIIKSLQI